jgi:NAD(P)-dependent dehydrogenase (short-subunit alcohol dehydrogenase family)
MMLLEGRVAIVTGGGRGLGRAHALGLASLGAAVVVNDPGASLDGGTTTEAPADDVVTKILGSGGRAVANHDSVSDWGGCEAIVETALTEFGRLDAVVNNAGITRDHMITSSTEQDFDTTIGVHLKGTYGMCRHAARYWREAAKRGEDVTGRIINTTSGAGMFGNVGQTAYAAAKAGIIGLTQTMALEARRYGVTVNAISPVALTRMTENIVTGSATSSATSAGGDGKIEGFDPLDPANASGLVCYLASAESGWLTGQVLRIDGNKVVRMQEWSAIGEYASSAGGAVSADELVDGLPKLYGVLPRAVFERRA